MKIKYALLYLLTISLYAILSAGTIRSYTLKNSLLLKKDIIFYAILPVNYDSEVAKGKRYPVLYLLHSMGGSAGNWFRVNSKGNVNPSVDLLIDNVSFIAIALGDGKDNIGNEFNSWWLDSPMLSNSRWSSFIAIELKAYVDNNLKTIADRKNTGIMGFSMGGFGAFHNLKTSPDVFSIAVGFNAAFAIARYQTEGWEELKKSLATVLGSNPQNYRNFDITLNADSFINKNCRLSIMHVSSDGSNGDCFIIDGNNLHNSFNTYSVTHEFKLLPNPELCHRYPSMEEMKNILTYFDRSFALGRASRSNRMMEEITLSNLFQ
jgi:S-formylglutathione hydrolase FrmB